MCNMIESYWLIRGKFMKFLYKLKAFTLAEVMITLTIIGVISAIVVPVAFHSRPDENVMKFKKAHNTLYQVINTLVTSDKYYKDGDLGIKADGNPVTYTSEMMGYFCNTFADLLSTKFVNCCKYEDASRTGNFTHWLLSNETIAYIANGSPMKRTVNDSTIKESKKRFDSECKKSGKTFGAEIITTDGVAYYQAGKPQFGSSNVAPSEHNELTEEIKLRYFSPPGQFPAFYSDEQGNDIAYKIFCIDIDGIPENVTTTDCVNECPFGYGIRADGKIMNGARADEWLEKDIQGEN